MALYKATTSFTGLITMAKGQVRDISDKALAKDLLKAGYLEEVKTKTPKKEAAKK